MNHIKFILLAFFLNASFNMAFSQNNSNNSDTFTIFVDGACGMCQDRIESNALKVKGVKSANWSELNKQLIVTVDSNKFDLQMLHQKLASVGHNTKLVTASDEVYKTLPLCCQYIETHAHVNENVIAPLPLPQTGPIFGKVLELDSDGNEQPIVAANVYWAGSTEGTITDVSGIFVLPLLEGHDKIVVSYVGFGSDTLTGPFEGDLKVLISNNLMLSEVEVIHRQKSTSISYLNTMKVESINEKELLKAACCNLSESFETNPSIDVSFTDAITGTRQIQMLGLAGPYVQVMRENMPDIRSISSIAGFTYTPGPWIQSIQLNKGTGSVINGFESMTGQINVELRKPEEGERLYLNVYGNQGSRLEANLNTRHSLNDNTHTGLLLHASTSQKVFDNNNDSFLDMPIYTNFIGLNRWKFILKNGWRSQVGIKGTLIDHKSGQTNFITKENNSEVSWGADSETKRGEVWLKMGRVFEDKPYKSLGFQLSGTLHDTKSIYGNRVYNANQKSLFFNFIYQSIIGNTNHAFKTGVSSYYDLVDELVVDEEYSREEIIPGAYFEYTFSPSEKFGLVAGIRTDYHNTTGLFLTPRIHARYAPAELTVLRASIGRGRRTSSIFAENIGLFASSREIIIKPTQNGNQRESTFDYGLTPEVVWNGGINLTQGFIFAGRSAVLGIDLYRTIFEEQVVVDFDQNPQEVHFYSLEGKSYSNSIQIQFDYELISKLDVRVAYRLNDVKTDFRQGLLTNPLISKNRAFINLGYETEGKWKFDFTLNWQGEKRIPSTELNPSEFGLSDVSPSFFMANAQVSKSFGEKFEMYLGGENLFNFRQLNPIISSNDPFGNYFDASLVWGPIFGRNIYMGARYRLN